MESRLVKKSWILAIVCILIAVISFTVIAPKASSPNSYTAIVKSLDDKKENVLKLTAAATATSAAVTLIPGDTATPIAEKIADLTTYFMWVLCAIFLEKYLLTIIGAAVFRILVPVGCLLAAAFLLWRKEWSFKLAVKLLLFSVGMFCVIPASVWASDKIDATFEENITATLQAAEETEKEIEAVSTVSEAVEANTDDAENSAEESQEDQGLFSNVAEGVGNVIEGIGGVISDGSEYVENAVDSLSSGLDELVSGELLEKAKDLLNQFIEAVAVMLVTSCVIPILVLVFCFWLVKLLMEIEIPSLPSMKK